MNEENIKIFKESAKKLNIKEGSFEMAILQILCLTIKKQTIVEVTNDYQLMFGR